MTEPDLGGLGALGLAIAPASLRSRLLAEALRRFAKPRTLDPPDPVGSRAAIDRFVRPPPIGVAVRALTLGGVAAEEVRGRGRADGAGRPAATLLYLHGGAYALCSPATHRPLTAAFATRGFRVVVPRYRLAPEHPFPAALDDAVAACRALREEIGPDGRLVLAGDSAGGGLALALMLRLREAGEPLPEAAALFSPWTDLAATGATMRTNARRDPLFHPDRIDDVAALYLGGTDPRHPLASPLYADLAGLPPLLLHVGESEILLDDSRRLAARATDAGVAVSLKVWPAVPHGWQLLAALLPEARRSVDEAAAFLKRGAAG